MALIQNTGNTPDGQSAPLPISGPVFTFQGNIADGASKSTDWFDTSSYDALGFVFVSNKTGYYTLEYSEDGTALFVPMITVQYTDVNTRRKGAVDQDAKLCRITWYNNSGSAATLSMKVTQKTGNYQPSLETLGAKGAATRFAQWVKSLLHLPDSNGAYDDVLRTDDALNVYVKNPGTATDTSGLATKDNQTNGNQRSVWVNGNNVPYGTQAQPVNVTVTNQPGTQPVSGSVSVSNFPVTQPVSGSVNVGNFPGSTEISNDVGNPIPVSGTVSVGNFPATQPVSGSVSVGNFPATQAVSGTVNVGNFPATQPISGNVGITGTVNTPVAASGAGTSYTLAAAVQQTIAANTARRGAIVNVTAGVVVVALGFTATNTLYTYRIVTNGVLEIPREWAQLSISMFSQSGGTAVVTQLT